MKRIGLLLVVCFMLVMPMVVWAADENGFDVLVPSKGTPTYHWWEEHLWKSAVKMDGKAIEVKYTGKRFLLNYIKFVPLGGAGEIIWTDFKSAQPPAYVLAYGSDEYKDVKDKWGIRIEPNMGDVGLQTLAANDNMESLPNLILFPDLTGYYDIYVCLRAVDTDSSVALRLTDYSQE